MNLSPFIIVALLFVFLLFLIILIYFQIYKKNINKVLSEKENKPKHMLEPYKLMFILIVLLISASITVTSIAGLMYSDSYFQNENDFNSRTVYVDFLIDDNQIKKLDFADAENINDILTEKYRVHKCSVIPVYTCIGVTMNEKVNLFAIDEKYCSFLGLKEMVTGTVYSSNELAENIELEINVTKMMNDGGFLSDKLEHITLKTNSQISDNSLETVLKRNLTPSTQKMPTLFINMETFYNITSLLVDEKINNENDFASFGEIIYLEGIYIYADSLSLVSPINTTLSMNGYNAYALEDSFDNFEKAISTTFKIFICASSGLIFLSAVNIYLTIRAINKLKRDD
ncbi:MAG: hypothetical protein NC122_09380 [Faecalibacterium sp.]|nr:hypothetical protein [Ruminococcus sp.]MCM1392414.1 hypothetical protein [Ruminococcus sp.]MCM1486402.1 hypothetical protein [Faecalibacterium sp.]